MDSVFLRVNGGLDGGRIYPLSAFGYISNNSRGHLHIVVGDRIWLLADCHTEAAAIDLGDAILQEVIATIRAHRTLSTFQGPPALIIDLNEIADGNLAELQRDEDEAREMAGVDALLAAAEQNQETGYDGVRRDHSVTDCRGGGC